MKVRQMTKQRIMPIFLTAKEESHLSTLAATEPTNEKTKRIKTRAQIILLWSEGLTIKQTAEKISMSASMVSHIRKEYRKYGQKLFEQERRKPTDLSEMASKALKSGDMTSVKDVAELTLALLAGLDDANGTNAKVALDSLSVLLRCSQHLEPKAATDLAKLIDEAMA
tara:strand:+ start:1237 stop:1740 length:504 start_codon:yes stop_codon:yes gene_type:complete